MLRYYVKKYKICGFWSLNVFIRHLLDASAHLKVNLVRLLTKTIQSIHVSMYMVTNRSVITENVLF